ncbi:MAG: DUF2306 domain-containing protein [Myxococcaceae bacterium]|nr:DUF2306 domain-containing protein [Myxococcaceae bacterium]
MRREAIAPLAGAYSAAVSSGTPPTHTSTPGAWRTPLWLLALSVVPMLGGVARLTNLATAAPTPDTARFFDSPVPVVVHIVGSTLFAVLGAFQFSAGLRRRWPRWHRVGGRIAAAGGFLSGLTGTWMTLAYAIPRALQGPPILVTRLLVGPAVMLFIVLAVRAILRRDVVAHEAWMIRAYALAQGAGTQAVLLGPSMLLFGELTHGPRDALMVLAWLINVVVAEALVRARSPAAAVARRAAPG